MNLILTVSLQPLSTVRTLSNCRSQHPPLRGMEVLCFIYDHMYVGFDRSANEIAGGGVGQLQECTGAALDASVCELLDRLPHFGALSTGKANAPTGARRSEIGVTTRNAVCQHDVAPPSSSGPPKSRRFASITVARLRVKVVNRIGRGPDSSRRSESAFALCIATTVFPVPAPPVTRAGPANVSR